MGDTTAASRRQKQKCLVIGGAGFLGRHLVSLLLDQGVYDVSVLDVRDTGESRARFVKADIRNFEEVAAAVKGVHIVFHCATLAPLVQNTSTEAAMHAVNVVGTKNVMNACVKHSVPKLVYTSSSTVVFAGRDLVNVDESIPYAARPIDFYAKTKIDGERIILAENGKGGVATVALRPSNVYGEYDSLFLPLAVKKAKEGKMKYIIGKGQLNPTYAGNAAQAHIQAAEALQLDSAVAGQAYFVTDGVTMPFWDFIGDFLEPMGWGRPRIPLPGMLIFILAWILQYIIIPMMKPFMSIQVSEFSPSRIQLLICKRTFSIAKARRDFGYEPRISTADGYQRTLKYFSHLYNK